MSSELPQDQDPGATYSSNVEDQTNPFTADLKGEFTSNFGESTNAVSQIFKDGGFGGEQKTKMIAGVAAGVVLLAVAFFFMSDMFFGEDDMQSDEFAQQQDEESFQAEDQQEAQQEDIATQQEDEGAIEDGDEAVAEEQGEIADEESEIVDTEGSDETGSDEIAETSSATDAAASAEPAADAVGTGSIQLASPASGATANYDETNAPPVVSWQGSADYITFSRSRDMSTIAYRSRVYGNEFSFRQAFPGRWYWQLENSEGKSEVGSFRINPPVRRNVVVAQPSEGGAIAGNGGVVSWQGDQKVAGYRVEISSGDWTNPTHRFATSGTQLSVQGVSAGQYQMRVGAFSEVSGRWEYTAPMNVSVQ